jgi:hypothetical protein
MRSIVLLAILFAMGPVNAEAADKIFYFAKAIYTKCPPPPDYSNWTIEGPVSGPWIKGTMHADGKLVVGTYPTKLDTSGTNSFDFETLWTITSRRAVLLAASCKGSALKRSMTISPNAPWWEECTITEGKGKYAPYKGHHILTSGFYPAPCVENVSFMSGYKIVVD